jgi:hypothetical protein
VTVTLGESGGPGNVPAVPEVAVYRAVAGRATEVRLTLKRQPRDHRSPVAGTVAVRTIRASGLQVRFLVAFIPVDTWIAAITPYDAGVAGSAGSSATTSRRPTFPGPRAARELQQRTGPGLKQPRE